MKVKPRTTMARAGLLVVLVAFVGLPAAVWAADATGTGGTDPTVQLDFEINIPEILYLRVGSAGTATPDTITFDVATVPGTAVPGTSSGANPVPVHVGAVVPASQAVTLSADSSNPMQAGAAGPTISFTTVSWTAGAPFSSGNFDGTSAQVLDTLTGPGLRTGTYAFSYANGSYEAPGTYTGSVTYTLAAP